MLNWLSIGNVNNEILHFVNDQFIQKMRLSQEHFRQVVLRGENSFSNPNNYLFNHAHQNIRYPMCKSGCLFERLFVSISHVLSSCLTNVNSGRSATVSDHLHGG